MPVYLAIAYRWGWTNSHTYFISCSPNIERVLPAAEHAWEDRHGKYGVAVLQMSEDPSRTPEKRLFYFPSSRGEEAPYCNTRDEAYRLLGQRVFNAVQHGKTSLPSCDCPGKLDFVEVPVPQWLQQETQRAIERSGLPSAQVQQPPKTP